MKKHLAIFKTSMQDSFAYRSENFVWMIIEFIPIIMLSFVWLNVFEGRALIGGYSKDRLISYYIASFIIARFVSWYIHHTIAQEIKDGVLSIRLIKPYNYLLFKAVSNSAWRVQRYIILAPFLVFVLVSFRDSLYINLELVTIILMLLALILAVLVYLFVSLLLGIFAFWFQKVEGIFNLYWVLRNVFSGAIIPLTLLPKSFISTAKILPFRYTFSFPLEIYFGQLDSRGKFLGFVLGLSWLLFFYFLTKLLWRAGLKRYASVGG